VVTTSLREVQVRIGGAGRGRRSPDIFGTLLREDDKGIVVAPWGVSIEVEIQIPIRRVTSIVAAEDVSAKSWVAICKTQAERWPGSSRDRDTPGHKHVPNERAKREAP
jgi:hypothetical protein